MPAWSSLLLAENARLLGAALALLVLLLLQSLANGALSRMVSENRVPALLQRRLRLVLRLCALFVAVVLALHVAGAFEEAWAVLSAVLTTVAIGFFALWSVLSNVVCAFLILVFRPFRVGDEIEVLENGVRIRGRVLDMNLLFVTLQEAALEDNATALLQVPNNLFLQKTVRRFQAVGSEREGFFD